MTKNDHSPACPVSTHDISALTLLTAVLKVMVALTLLATGISLLYWRSYTLSVLCGALIGLTLYCVAWYSGRMAIIWRRYVPAVLLLFGLQILVWIVIYHLFSTCHIEGSAFAIGAGILPVSIVGTVLWQALFPAGGRA